MHLRLERVLVDWLAEEPAVRARIDGGLGVGMARRDPDSRLIGLEQLQEILARRLPGALIARTLEFVDGPGNSSRSACSTV